jgi:hypothetical protein
MPARNAISFKLHLIKRYGIQLTFFNNVQQQKFYEFKIVKNSRVIPIAIYLF